MSGTISLQYLGASFKQWRSGKRHRARIPEELWAMAVEAAKHHPVSHIAKAGGLDFYQLRARIEKRKESEKALAPVNVTKIVSHSSSATAPIVEIESPNGTKVRFFGESAIMRAVLEHAFGG